MNYQDIVNSSNSYWDNQPHFVAELNRVTNTIEAAAHVGKYHTIIRYQEDLRDLAEAIKARLIQFGFTVIYDYSPVKKMFILKVYWGTA